MKRLPAAGVFFLGFWRASPASAEPPVGGRAALVARAGDASVSLGVLRAQGDVRAETAGFVSVAFPLDRAAASRPLVLADASDGVGLADAMDLSVTEARLADAPLDDTADTIVTPALEPALLASLAQGAVAAAQNAHHGPESARDLDSIATRARTSATLPELRLRALRARDESLRLQPTEADPSRFSLAGGDDTLFEVQATFRLNRLVFADEELPVERLRIERERLNERLEARVTAWVVAWHRALSHEQSAPDPETRGRAALARVSAGLELDVLTAGWFSARLRRMGLATAVVPVERHAPPPPDHPAPPQPGKTKGVSRDGEDVARPEGSTTTARSTAVERFHCLLAGK